MDFATKIKFNMKKILIILFIPIIFSCSDDDSNNNNAGSFLADYNGVIWLEDGNDEIYDYWWIFTPNGVTNGERYATSCDASYDDRSNVIWLISMKIPRTD